MSNSVQWWLYDHFDVKLSKTNTIWRYTLSDCKILLKRNGSPVFIMDQWQTAFSEVFSSSYPYPHWASMPFHTHRCLDTLYHWNTFTFKLLLCKYLFCFKDFFYISMVKYMLNLWQRLLVQKWPSSWNCNQKMYVKKNCAGGRHWRRESKPVQPDCHGWWSDEAIWGDIQVIFRWKSGDIQVKIMITPVLSLCLFCGSVYWRELFCAIKKFYCTETLPGKVSQIKNCKKTLLKIQA